MFFPSLKLRPGDGEGELLRKGTWGMCSFRVFVWKLLSALRFFLGVHMECDLAKLSLESPHGHSEMSQ